ncbi:hypothetical protein ACFCYC_36975 [Streptomyces sp. NPDC056402]|uniref:hypothetical protein n=1 Tax=Streptomyces sp. NPDC056402 TaxID=3345810 RepID=UPI0035DCC3E7
MPQAEQLRVAAACRRRQAAQVLRHRRAELLRLRVLVSVWQPQPQQLMAEMAGIPGPGTATGERYAVAGFRRLLEDRAQRARDHSDFADGWLPRA